MPSPNVRGREPLHERCQFAVLPGPENQVPVIGHQTVREEPNWHDFNGSLQDAFEGGEVAVVVKYLPAVVAAIEAMEDYATGRYAVRPRHYCTVSAAVDAVNICPYPLF
jgi:hypothetical protein